MIKWLKNRKLQKEKQQFNNGFDWAAGSLLRSEQTPISIEALITDYSASPLSSFDKGCNAAIRCLTHKHKIIKDDTF